LWLHSSNFYSIDTFRKSEIINIFSRSFSERDDKQTPCLSKIRRNVLFRLRTPNFLVFMIFILIHSFRVDLRLLTDIVVYWPLQNAFHSFEFKRQCVYMHVIIYYYLINKVFIFLIYAGIVRLTSINLQNKNS
jgi:hypothetical protein